MTTRALWVSAAWHNWFFWISWWFLPHYRKKWICIAVDLMHISSWRINHRYYSTEALSHLIIGRIKIPIKSTKKQINFILRCGKNHQKIKSVPYTFIFHRTNYVTQLIFKVLLLHYKCRGSKISSHPLTRRQIKLARCPALPTSFWGVSFTAKIIPAGWYGMTSWEEIFVVVVNLHYIACVFSQ
jgi:hypothetical protein